VEQPDGRTGAAGQVADRGEEGVGRLDLSQWNKDTLCHD
jgi:hypothetical protein